MVGLAAAHAPVPDEARALLAYWFGRSIVGSAGSPGSPVSPDSIDPVVIERWRSLGALHVPGWRSDPGADHALRTRFEPFLAQAGLDLRRAWTQTASGRLAYIVLYDQLPRAAYRGTRRAYEHDPLAFEVAREAIARGDDAGLSAIERAFFYMPFTHAEDLAAQDEACERFAALCLGGAAPEVGSVLRVFLESANRHRRIIRRFGRFPNRNAVLGRVSTEDEQRYLDSPWTFFETDCETDCLS